MRACQTGQEPGIYIREMRCCLTPLMSRVSYLSILPTSKSQVLSLSFRRHPGRNRHSTVPTTGGYHLLCPSMGHVDHAIMIPSPHFVLPTNPRLSADLAVFSAPTSPWGSPTGEVGRASILLWPDDVPTCLLKGVVSWGDCRPSS
ncbi:hypothetical protein MPH_05948 [Macrophomina phaseolina MS6]|uniref:Uncharacterized protein n=1 Tax=Macrophomina phaseolina (strain MS6) TaxID=1126212 RepID=K2SJ28_MACPH|nr:hypothetical protein MPH_05948 [Macrophomina phaseolina MS6]